MKFWVVLFGLVLTTGAFATDDTTDDVVEEEIVEEEVVEEEVEASVVERVSCTDIQAQITELSAIEEPDEETLEELANLRATHRSKCVRKAGNRRVAPGRKALIAAAEATVAPEEELVTEEIVEEEPVEEEKPKKTKKKKKKEKNDAPVEEAAPELTAEQVQSNLDAGLCADGTKPNRFGCCGDEIFKDLGNMVFACCPKSGGDCLPPIKK
ncbi:MAG: hypothetical protein IJY99_00265 [Alphaproteobacteria bacterium]|nr:hypothetical protein [Alphaproteobacteria bacterium]